TTRIRATTERSLFDSRPHCQHVHYQAASWDRPRRVIAKIEHHLGELFPRVGFIVTTPTGTNRAIVRFYNQRGTAEQWIKEGKAATHWTRLSCHRFRANEVRLLLGVIAYNLGNLLGSFSPSPFKTGPSEPSGGAAQDRRAPDSARSVFHLAARGKLLDRAVVSPDSPAHRAAGVAPDMIGQTVPRRVESTPAGVSLRRMFESEVVSGKAGPALLGP